MTDEEFVAAFENCTLPLASFRHADHVRMAFLYLSKYSPLDALRNFSTSLAKFATAHGKTSLYNATITWAYMLIIQERLARVEQRQNWVEFAAANQDLLDRDDSVLNKYYREETRMSDFARSTFVFPDK